MLNMLLIQEKRNTYAIDYDHLWKTVITELFEPFMHCVAPGLAEKIEWRHEPKPLEQELLKLFPGATRKGKRVSDKLIEVKLKNGKNQWILIHVEIQQSKENNFALRMYQYFYRTFDKYEQKICAIAILTDGNRSFHPTAYEYHFHGTKLTYQFNTYKILDQDENELLRKHNPFAYVILAGMYVIKSKNNMNKRYQFKRKLMILIMQDQRIHRRYKRSYLTTLFSFIDYLLYIPVELKEKLQKEINPLIEREVPTLMQPMKMEPSPMLKDYIAMKREEGIKEGQKQNSLTIASEMLNEGFSVEMIAQLTKLSEKEIVGIKKGI